MSDAFLLTWKRCLQAFASIEPLHNLCDVKAGLHIQVSKSFAGIIKTPRIFSSNWSTIMKDEQWREAHAPHNVILDWRLKANYRTGYWEVIFSCIKPL